MTFITSRNIFERQAFFSSFLPKGSICFDIGANHGEYLTAFLATGAKKVIAVEPQREPADFIKKMYPKEISNGRLIIKTCAIGAKTGVAKFYPGPDIGKSMSTLSSVFLDVSKGNGDRWDESQAYDVNITTLDEIIKEYGEPDYIKIDVEGYDLEALQGLSTPVTYISFEYNCQPRLIDIAEKCILRIDEIGSYEFNFQAEYRGSKPGLMFQDWVSAEVMRYTLLHDMARINGLCSDIYARRVK